MVMVVMRAVIPSHLEGSRKKSHARKKTREVCGRMTSIAYLPEEYPSSGSPERLKTSCARMFSQWETV